MQRNGVVLNMPESHYSGPKLFPGWAEYDLLFDVDKVNPLLKKNAVGLFVSGWVVVAWGRKF